MRADQLLVERGLASSRSQAQRLIDAGVEWQQGGGVWRRVVKNGDVLPADAPLRLLDAAESRYVSRGGLKLEGALRHTGLAVTGLTVIDVGQSTGGFTDCLLQAGAVRVVGLDVGQGQLNPALRADARVQCIERINARDTAAVAAALCGPEVAAACETSGGTREASGTSDATGPSSAPRFDLLVGDLSFISQTLVLPALVPWCKPGAQVLMLVKPQFELQPGQVGKGGIVREPALYALVEQKLRAAYAGLGLVVRDWFVSSITGGDGNREFFIWAHKPQE